jgi:glucose-6-phosphate 1-dehydrogenase
VPVSPQRGTMNEMPFKAAKTSNGTAVAPPCVFVIFGASGDLTKRLLMPAIYNLVNEGLLNEDFTILGVNRGDDKDGAFAKGLVQSMTEIIEAGHGEAGKIKVDEAAKKWLESRIAHQQGDITDPKMFSALGKSIDALTKGKSHGNVVFYLATAPEFFGPIVEGLGKAGLTKQDDHQFRRIIIEKPFGTDLKSARALDEKILQVVEEDQIFRIDHFLGKETVQNIMVLRFANFMFEPIWNRDHIDSVQITAAETVGVETRGKFYDKTGAMRDMVPNHMFQLLAMMTMEAPNSFDADAIRAEKAKVIEAVRRMTPDEALKNSVRGQYVFGEVNGKPMQAYRQSPDVDTKSKTETYIALKLFIDNWRWAGVPFYIRTGKAMTARKTEVVIQFKKAPGVLFRDVEGGELSNSRLVFRIQPDEGVQMRFSVKQPGRKVKLSDVNMNFRYSDYFKSTPSTGYETLIYDCLIGDATLFQRADNVESGWAVVQPLLDAWAQGHDQVHWYEAGSAGPTEADDLLARDGRKWLAL